MTTHDKTVEYLKKSRDGRTNRRLPKIGRCGGSAREFRVRKPTKQQTIVEIASMNMTAGVIIRGRVLLPERFDRI